eukprot:Nk52_evm24s539 gene=Nk52_evmTU24s539
MSSNNKILEERVNEAIETFNKFASSKKKIPREELRRARGIVIIKCLKVSLGINGRGGHGIILRKNDEGMWSAPAAISCFGMERGLQLGAENIHSIFILYSDTAVRNFMSSKMALGGQASASLGSHGAVAQSTPTLADCNQYSLVSGAYVGFGKFTARFKPDVKKHKEFYGTELGVLDIVEGGVAPPQEAFPLYDTLGDCRPSTPNQTPQICITQPSQPVYVPKYEQGLDQEETASPPPYLEKEQ